MIRILIAVMMLAALSLSAEARPHRHRHSHSATVASSIFIFGSGIVSRARSYLGTNPTGTRSLWCGRFLAIVAPGAAAKVHNPAWARSWLALPHTSAQIGSIAVMARRGGGHVGVVSGFDSAGNPIIVSGNNMGAVREGVYPRSRVLAYVSAD